MEAMFPPPAPVVPPLLTNHASKKRNDHTCT